MSPSSPADHTGDVAHARRTETLVAAEQRRDLPPDLLVRLRQPDVMAGQTHPGAVQRDAARRASLCSAKANAGAGSRG